METKGYRVANSHRAEILAQSMRHGLKGHEIRLLRKKFYTKQSWARRHDVAFDLTLDWFIEQYKKGCACTGESFNLEKPAGYFHPRGKGHNKRYPGQLSFHRARPELGYVMGNTYIVLLSVNDTIGNLSPEALMHIAAFHWTTARGSTEQQDLGAIVRLDDYRNEI